MSPNDKDLVWLHGEVKTPLFRINDENWTWRIVYRIDDDAIVILAVFDKKTSTTPKQVIDTCKERIRRYDDESS